MKAIKSISILSILLLLRVECLVVRPSGNVKRFDHSAQSTESTIENNILKGPVVAIDNGKIGEVIYDVLSADPDHISQIDAVTGNQITFREMKDRSIRLALWIQKLEFGPGDVVVECSQNHVDSYVPFFATFFLDAIFSAWHPNPSLGKAQRLMQQFSPRLIFTDVQSADVLLKAATLENSNVKIVVLGKHSNLQSLNEILSFQTDEEVGKFAVVNEKSPEETAVILTTSGTTGFPKGVLLSGKSVMAIATGSYGIDSSEALRVLWYANLSWIACLRHTLQTIIQKNVIVVSSTSDGPEQTLRIIEKYNINAVRPNEAILNFMSNTNLTDTYNLQSLKILLVSGGKISLDIFEKIQQQLPTTFIQYVYGKLSNDLAETVSDTKTYINIIFLKGVTELGGQVTARTPNEKLTGSVGHVIANAQVNFVDLESNATLGPKQSGEIYVKTSTMMIEYYKNPEATKQVIDAEGWYHTGDLGYYSENGEIFVLGRIRDIIKYRNYKIVPSEIESTLLSHSDIEEAAVVPIPHEVDGHWPVAFVKKVPGSKVSENDLTKLMSVHEDYKQLRGGIYFIEKFPVTASQRVARNKLIEMAVNMRKSRSS